VGHHQVEELEHHRRDAPEMPGAVRALQDVLEVRGLDHEGLPLGIDFLLVRLEHDVHAGGLEPRAVSLERARIAVEVLARAELQAVDEDADHRARRARLGDVDQLDVAVVQVAHGRHEHVVRHALQARAQVGGGVDDVH
jgi:hypothetical protein